MSFDFRSFFLGTPFLSVLGDGGDTADDDNVDNGIETPASGWGEPPPFFPQNATGAEFLPPSSPLDMLAWGGKFTCAGLEATNSDLLTEDSLGDEHPGEFA